MAEVAGFREDLYLEELLLQDNCFDLAAELSINDIALGAKDMRIEWVNPDDEREFSSEDVEKIVEHYGLPAILHDLLIGETLLPLISNEALLSQITIDNDETLADFIEDAFFSEEEVRFFIYLLQYKTSF